MFPTAPTPPAAPPLPPACADCLTTLKMAKEGQLPVQTPSKLFRNAEGKIRVDCGDTSMISDPKTGETLLLDHLKKEARLIPSINAPRFGPDGLPLPPLPTPPTPPELPKPPDMSVQDLGKRFIEGVEATGKKYIIQPPQPPGLPAPPQAPNIQPNISEVWTSTKHQLPILSKVTGKFGEQTCYCKMIEAGEPPASMFQIPPGYTTVPAVKPPPIPSVGG